MKFFLVTSLCYYVVYLTFFNAICSFILIASHKHREIVEYESSASISVCVMIGDLSIRRVHTTQSQVYSRITMLYFDSNRQKSGIFTSPP